MESVTDTFVIPRNASCSDMSALNDMTIASQWTDGNDSSDAHSGSVGFSGIQGSAHSCRLQGRQEEIAKMKKCFTDVATLGDAQLLLVAGVSGSGKSALVEHLRDFVTSPECNGFFCEGKFEQSLLDGATTEPLRAVATAFSDVIDFMLNQEGNLQERSKAVSQVLGADMSLLVGLVPNLSLLLGAAAQPDVPKFSNSAERTEQGASTKTSTHLAILFRNFLRSLTSEHAPILLFLDDLQFADSDSLDLFRALVTDSSLKHVLIVGSYRSNEMSMKQLLDPAGDSKRMPSTLPTTLIDVGNLDLSAINAGLAERLRLSEETTRPLSKVVLQKSGGNPFYVTQYLTVLQVNHLLVYNMEEERWVWDIDQILLMTNVSNNVLELVSQRLKALPSKVRALLTLIAFIGFRFKVDFVETILRQLAGMSSNQYIPENRAIIETSASLLRESKSPAQNRAAIEEVLRKAAKDGLVEECSSVMYKFTHDRIQQALYEMVETEGSRSELHYNIGHAVLSLGYRSLEEKTSNSFFVADQLNRGISHMTEEAELVELGEINLKVGKVAASRAAYQSAASYLRSGMRLLKDSVYWKSRYFLMIDLCISTAEIEAKMSNFDRSRKLCERVLLKASSLDDKVRAYVCLVSSYCIQESFEDAISVGTDFLSQVGVKLPAHPTLAHVMVNVIQTKKCMYKVSNSMILESPMMSDNKMEKAIKVLNMLATAYYLMANTGEMFAIIVMRMVQLTRRFGLARTTAKGFALYAMLASGIGDTEQALRYGDLALALMQSPSHRNDTVEASVLTVVYAFVLWRSLPVQALTERFVSGVEFGQQQGDLEWAYYAANGAIGSMFFSGYYLHETLQLARKWCSEMIEYEVHSPGRMTIPFWQIMENIAGNDDNTYKLTGIAMDEDEMIENAEENKNLFALEIINSVRLCAAVIFQQWDLALELAPLVAKGIKFIEAHFFGFTMRFFLGLTYSESYLRHGRSIDLRRLAKISRKLERLDSSGAGNWTPLNLILQAELAVTKINTNTFQKEATKAQFEKAIDQCFTQNLINYRALTAERASRICQLHGDKEGAVEFMADALECYRDWGAFAKVEQIEEVYFDLTRTP